MVGIVEQFPALISRETLQFLTEDQDVHLHSNTTDQFETHDLKLLEFAQLRHNQASVKLVEHKFAVVSHHVNCKRYTKVGIGKSTVSLLFAVNLAEK